MQQKPVVYLFHGDDIVSINEAIADLKSRVGSPSTVELNFSVLDGRSVAVEQVETACRTLPFLADRRLTVIKYPLALMQNGANRKRVLDSLGTLPDECAVILFEPQPLQSPKEKRNGIQNYLQKWAASMGGKVYVRESNLPHLPGWIIQRARKMGGEIEPRAANRMSALVGSDVYLAEQEIIKLLTYVNYERPVTEADVVELTALQQDGFIFDFVDALGDRDRKKAVNEFHRLLADSDGQNIFGMIVRQFRLLVQSREIIDQQGGEQEIASKLGVHNFVGKKLAHQANQFSQAQLDAIFHRLLEIDSRLKTGQMSIDLSIDLLIADLR
jgi:DNA polymerase-3 subunit delta